MRNAALGALLPLLALGVVLARPQPVPAARAPEARPRADREPTVVPSLPETAVPPPTATPEGRTQDTRAIMDRIDAEGIVHETDFPAILAVLDDPASDPERRLAAVWALGKLRGASAWAVLRRYLAHPDAEVRTQAVNALVEWDAPETGAALLERLAADPSEDVRVASAYVLSGFASLGEEPARAIAAVLREARSESEGRAMAAALARTERPLATAELMQGVRGRAAESVRVACAEGLQSAHDPAVARELDELAATEGSETVRAAIAEAVKHIRGEFRAEDLHE